MRMSRTKPRYLSFCVTCLTVRWPVKSGMRLEDSMTWVTTYEALAEAEYVLGALQYEWVEERMWRHQIFMGCRPGLKTRCPRPRPLTVRRTKWTWSSWIQQKGIPQCRAFCKTAKGPAKSFSTSTERWCHEATFTESSIREMELKLKAVRIVGMNGSVMTAAGCDGWLSKASTSSTLWHTRTSSVYAMHSPDCWRSHVR